jgi:hypothetical protein
MAEGFYVFLILSLLCLTDFLHLARGTGDAAFFVPVEVVVSTYAR